MKIRKPEIDSVVSSGTSTSTVYDIEVTLAYPDNPPIQIGDMIVDGQWRKVSIIHSSRIGVPNNLFNKEAIHHGYLEHDAAMALAYWVIAAANRAHVKVRLVEHEFESTHKVTLKRQLTPIRTHDPISRMLRRSKPVGIPKPNL